MRLFLDFLLPTSTMICTCCQMVIVKFLSNSPTKSPDPEGVKLVHKSGPTTILIFLIIDMSISHWYTLIDVLFEGFLFSVKTEMIRVQSNNLYNRVSVYHLVYYTSYRKIHELISCHICFMIYHIASTAWCDELIVKASRRPATRQLLKGPTYRPAGRPNSEQPII